MHLKQMQGKTCHVLMLTKNLALFAARLALRVGPSASTQGAVSHHRTFCLAGRLLVLQLLPQLLALPASAYYQTC